MSVSPPPPPDVLKVAVTVVFAVSVRVQLGEVPEHPPPLQPANVEPEDGVAVKVTEVPEENDLEHVEPQLMPEGLLVTVPVPVPDLFTWSVTPFLPLRSNAGDPISGAVVGVSRPHDEVKINATMIPDKMRLLTMDPPQ